MTEESDRRFREMVARGVPLDSGVLAARTAPTRPAAEPNPCPPFDQAPAHARAEYTIDDETFPPCCSGLWLHGSGGHRVHEGQCNVQPSWWHPDNCYAYCDEHIPEGDRKSFARLWAVRLG